jgi:tetratricopeptide (TPR) repeat protein
MQIHPPNLFNPQTGCLTEQALFDYIDGRLSAPACHQAEKHMLDCAFCSDAVEGLEQVKDRRSVHVHPPKEEKTGTDRGLILPFHANVRLAAAAVLVLFLGAYILFGYILNQEKAMEMSQTDAKEKIVSPEAELPGVSDDQIFSDNFKPGSTETARKELAYQESFKVSPAAPDEESDSPSQVVPAAGTPAGTTQAAPIVPGQEEGQNKVSERNETEARAPAAGGAGNEQTQANAPAAGVNLALSVAPARAEIATDEVVAKKERSSRFRGAKKSTASAPAAAAQNTGAAKTQETPPEADVLENKSAQEISSKADDRSDQAPNTTLKASPKAAADSMIYKKQTVTTDKNTHTETPVTSVAPAPKTKAHTKSAPKQKAFVADLLEEGLNAYDHKSYALALELFGKVLSAEPGNQTALLFSGFSYLSIGPADTQAAITCFDILLHSRDKGMHAEAAWFKALALIKESKKEEAVSLLKSLVETVNPYQESARQLLKELGK